MAELILASASPRRLELLSRVGATPEVVPADVDESVRPGEGARAYVERVALDKARAVARRRPDAVVLGADTAVVLEDHILGKPVDEADAVSMLSELSGRTHSVLTAVAAVHGETGARVRTETASVTFAAVQPAEIAWYVSTGEPLDKAGAYALQGIGAFLVERIEGDPTTVIGLPLRTTITVLRELGVRLADAGRAAPSG